MATKYSAHDASGGGVGSIGDPYTDQELFDNVDGSTNALGLMMNTGVYTPAATLNFDINAGTLLLPNVIRGANADGSDDGTIATISGSGLGASDDLFDIGLSMSLILENLRITAATRYNIYTDQAIFLDIINCIIDSATSHNFYSISSASIHRFYKTDIYGSTGGSGIDVNVAARGGYSFYRCSIHDNNSHGVRDGASNVRTKQFNIIDSLIYDNGGDGLNLELLGANYILPCIRGCVFFGNTGDGVAISNTAGDLIFENNIGRSNGGYFINTNTGTIKQIKSCKNNCSHNNTSGHIDINGGTLPGTGNITADPLFTSEVDGSEDFSLQAGSPCLNTAIDAGILTAGGGTSYRDIGAVQRVAGAGGLANPIMGHAIIR